MKSNYYNYVSKEDYMAIAGPDWPEFNVFKKHETVEDWVYKEIDQMLPIKKKFSDPAWCPKPFFSYEYPENVHCCLLPKKHNIKKIREEMLHGIRPDECNKCWQLEDNRQISDRQLAQQSLNYYSKLNTQFLYDQSEKGNLTIRQVSIDTSNRCNSTCVTCNKYNSSSWALLEQKNNNIIASTNWTVSKSEIDKHLEYNDIKMISFRGGEPLLSSTNFEILEHLVQIGNTDCHVSFVSNSSLKPTTRQIEILKKFSNINFCLSIDGIKEKFEYIRFPLKWSDTLSNLNWFRERNYDVSVSYTVSNLNVLYHNETTEWFVQNDLPFLINPVYFPAYFSPSVLPKEIKQSLSCRYPEYSIDHLLQKNTQNEKLWNEFKKQINYQDNLKGIQIKSYLPELAELIQNF